MVLICIGTWIAASIYTITYFVLASQGSSKTSIVIQHAMPFLSALFILLVFAYQQRERRDKPEATGELSRKQASTEKVEMQTE